jgi:hypothetical protein
MNLPEPPVTAKLRERFKPRVIKLLFIAESPPTSGSQYFYDPDCARGNFHNTLMRATFPDCNPREGTKLQWLTRFMDRGCYLIDATETPVDGGRYSTTERNAMVAAGFQVSLSAIDSLIERGTPIVLLQKNVFDICALPLLEAGHNVIHQTYIPMPANGQQGRALAALRECLDRIGFSDLRYGG